MTNAEMNFKALLKKMNHYEQALSLMAWDSRTGAPKKSINQRAEAMSTLSSEHFALSISDEMKQAITHLKEDDTLSHVMKRAVEEAEKMYNEHTKIPAEDFKAFVLLQSKAEAAWEEAKERSDFEFFKPYLEELVAFKKRFIGYIGFEDHPYHTLLDAFEPGVFTETLDSVFSELKKHLIPLVKQVTEAETKPETSFLFEHFPKEAQKNLSEAILKTMGYDFDKGRLNETVHPFAIGINLDDVRVTTKYDEHDFRVALLGTIHEGGHALYEQNIDSDLINYSLAKGTSMGIHESQSLFWEKFVGQSYPFWKTNYPVLKEYASGQFDNIDLDTFYFALNEAKPSLIRIEADELTYCLHIILRYELEKELFEEKVNVAELPRRWNEKVEEYLIQPENDGEGVLQDVHWSSGSFGYFPSYALGLIYAAQLKEAILKDLPNFDELIETNQLHVIQDWLRSHVHQYGKVKKPKDIIHDITGGGIDPQPLIRYLTDKYTKLYNL
ncbi:LOW QUALITY PROTEIN: thermostable carboxypeptidase 1 [Bacillus sp. JCM 19045]|nr:LOW QUALITY PROTEIN: thermostable carboxypeptidase 1 [Bacillus sp. JCM 19045]